MDTQRLNKIRFRAWRRGFREADLILGGFADAHLATLGEAEVQQFERLLEQPDHDIYAWILGQAPPPPAFDDDLLRRIRAFRPGAAATAP